MYKKYRKAISLFVVMILMIESFSGGMINVLGDTEYDTTAPVLKKVIINNGKDIIAGSEIPVTLDIVEDGVGVKNFTIKVEGEETGTTFYLKYSATYDEDSPVNNKSLLFTGKNNITVELSDGHFYNEKYIVKSFSISDNNQNRSYYEKDDIGNWFKDSTLSFTVKNSTKTDVTAPILNKFIISNNKINGKQSVNVNIDFTEEMGVVQILVWIQSKSDKTKETLLAWNTEKLNDKGLKSGNYNLTLKAQMKLYDGEYIISDIYLKDFEGNSAYYYPENGKNNFTDTITVVNNGKEDTTRPEVKSIKFKNKNIVTPNVLEVEFDLKTGRKGIDYISITVSN